MLVGFNYPWPANRYITIGPNLAPRGEPQQWTKDGTIARNFSELLKCGITVTRMWLLGDGTNYDGEMEFGFANNRGLYWDFYPPQRLNQSFLDDFDTLLELCKQTGMQLMPVLIDFKFFDEPMRNSRYFTWPGRHPTNGDYSQGRRTIAENEDFRKTFIDGTLRPLLERAAKYSGLIYAFDVMNEPSWCVDRVTGIPFGTSLFGRRLDPDHLTAFLRDCVKAVKDAGLRSTIGHRYLHNITGQFASIPVDLPQHHYYAHYITSRDYLMDKTESPKSAKVLGELGSITKDEFADLERKADNERDVERKRILKQEVNDFEPQKEQWPGIDHNLENDPKRILEVRLEAAEDRGYELAMIWPSPIGDPGRMTYDDLKLKSDKLSGVMRFTGKR